MQILELEQLFKNFYLSQIHIEYLNKKQKYLLNCNRVYVETKVSNIYPVSIIEGNENIYDFFMYFRYKEQFDAVFPLFLSDFYNLIARYGDRSLKLYETYEYYEIDSETVIQNLSRVVLVLDGDYQIYTDNNFLARIYFNEYSFDKKFLDKKDEEYLEQKLKEFNI